jgi:hypothetical protein
MVALLEVRDIFLIDVLCRPFATSAPIGNQDEAFALFISVPNTSNHKFYQHDDDVALL